METTDKATCYTYPVIKKREQANFRNGIESKAHNYTRSQILEDKLKKQREECLVLLKHICKFTCVEESTIQQKTRKREILIIRQIAHYLAYKYSEWSYISIGKVIGDTDHTTVMNSIKVINLAIDSNYSILNVCFSLDTEEIMFKTESKNFGLNEKFHALIEHIDVYLKSVGYKLSNRINTR